MSHSVGMQTGRPESARGDAAVVVPSFGQVEWSRAELDAHAELLTKTHRPDQPPTSIRVRWLPIPIPRTVRRLACCASCALDWPCPELRWAANWLSTKQRLIRALTHQPTT
jgi:hypothetical protein